MSLVDVLFDRAERRADLSSPRRLHSISYFSIWCCIVSSLYPFILDAPPVFEFSRSFFALIIPIGVFGFCAQALLTLGLQREKAGRGTLAVCVFFFLFLASTSS